MENPLHNNETIQKIKSDMLKEADTLGVKSRFGFFSIPYPATIGDRYYALKGKPHERDDRGKVVTLPRNIQTTVLKSGKSPDVYFHNIVKEDPKFYKTRQEFFKKQQEQYLDQIKKKKEDKKFNVPFKPSGPQDLKDFLQQNPYVSKVPIYKESPRKAYVDKQTKKVVIENKNILTQPSKKGTSSYPGILFSYPKTEKWGKPKRAQTAVKLKTQDNENDKDKFHQPFKPANTMLNGFFFPDKVQYGLPEKQLKQYEELYKRAKSAGGEKYIKPGKSYYSTHVRSFMPASGRKHGENGYFSRVYGVPFVPYVSKKRVVSSKEKGFSNAFK